jgi:hypothetical protein
VALVKVGDQLDRSCEKLRGATNSQGREEYSTNIKMKKDNWIGHILRRNCLLKHFIEKNKIERTGR